MSASNGLKFMPAWMFLTIHLASPVRTKCHWSKTSGPKWMKILRIIFMHRTGTKRYHRLAIPWQNSDGSDRGVKGRYSYGTWNHFVPQFIDSYIFKYIYKYNIYLRMGPSVATYFALFFSLAHNFPTCRGAEGYCRISQHCFVLLLGVIHLYTSMFIYTFNVLQLFPCTSIHPPLFFPRCDWLRLFQRFC